VLLVAVGDDVRRVPRLSQVCLELGSSNTKIARSCVRAKKIRDLRSPG
jgi:hypothetical protein